MVQVLIVQSIMLSSSDGPGVVVFVFGKLGCTVVVQYCVVVVLWARSPRQLLLVVFGRMSPLWDNERASMRR